MIPQSLYYMQKVYGIFYILASYFNSRRCCWPTSSIAYITLSIFFNFQQKCKMIKIETINSKVNNFMQNQLSDLFFSGAWMHNSILKFNQINFRAYCQFIPYSSKRVCHDWNEKKYKNCHKLEEEIRTKQKRINFYNKPHLSFLFFDNTIQYNRPCSKVFILLKLNNLWILGHKTLWLKSEILPQGKQINVKQLRSKISVFACVW